MDEWKIQVMQTENVMTITFICLLVNVFKFVFNIASWKLESLIPQ